MVVSQQAMPPDYLEISCAPSWITSRDVQSPMVARTHSDTETHTDTAADRWRIYVSLRYRVCVGEGEDENEGKDED